MNFYGDDPNEHAGHRFYMRRALRGSAQGHLAWKPASSPVTAQKALELSKPGHHYFQSKFLGIVKE